MARHKLDSFGEISNARRDVAKHREESDAPFVSEALLHLTFGLCKYHPFE
jgi:hypothetical protein